MKMLHIQIFQHFVASTQKLKVLQTIYLTDILSPCLWHRTKLIATILPAILRFWRMLLNLAAIAAAKATNFHAILHHISGAI